MIVGAAGRKNKADGEATAGFIRPEVFLNVPDCEAYVPQVGHGALMDSPQTVSGTRYVRM
ncbi:MAG: hypothetical protein Fues2KO_10650 [Fuerstiella sp.]